MLFRIYINYFLTAVGSNPGVQKVSGVVLYADIIAGLYKDSLDCHGMNKVTKYWLPNMSSF